MANNGKAPVKARELTNKEASERYHGLAQIGLDDDRMWKLNMPAQVWYPLSETEPLTQGLAQTNNFHLLLPKREPWNIAAEKSVPWFINRLSTEPVFLTASLKISGICHATPRLDLSKRAFNGQPAFGALPGFYYEAERSMGFRVNPQSMYASHVLFFSTGCRYDGKLVGLAKLATESSVWMQAESMGADESWRINLVVVHTHLLAKTLNYHTPLAMLQDLFIEPFNERYENAEKLAPARTEGWLRDKKAELSGLRAEELSKQVEEYNTQVMTFWNCFVKPSQSSWLKSWVDRPPTIQVLDGRRAMIYRASDHDRMLACSTYNMSVLQKMLECVNKAISPDQTPMEREHEFAKIFSIDSKLDDYGASSGKTSGGGTPSTAG